MLYKNTENHPFTKRFTPSHLAFGSACLLAAVNLLSPFLLSVSMWGLVAAALWHRAEQYGLSGKKGNIWLGGLATGFHHFFRQPSYWLISLLLLVPATSLFWSLNIPFGLDQVRVRIPFFVVPFAFANLPPITERQFKLVLYFLVWTMVCLCIGVMLNTIINFDLVLHNLKHGRPVPVPRNHIRFSLLIATAILCGSWLWQQRFTWHWPWERKALLGALVFLTLCLHVLAVRSALAALYAALFFSVVYFIIYTRRWLLGFLAAICLTLAPVGAYFALPSLQHRIAYMVYDWQQYKKNEGGSYSDAQRWVSLETGLQLWKANPLLGVGVGDLPMEVQKISNARFPNYTLEPKLPHNQFIYILCSTGIVGLLLSLIAFLAPFTRSGTRRFYLFLAFQVMILISFLVEYTIETAIGVAFYLFYTLWLSRYPIILYQDLSDFEDYQD